MIRNHFPDRPARCIAIVRIVTVALAVAGFVGRPHAARADDVAQGQRIWAEKAGCQQCHGWAGDGVRGFHSEGLAPSLRLTQLTRAQIRTTIQCGRPSTPMPHFDRFAYTDKRCYDMTAADLGNQVPNRAATTLQSYEIDGLVDYIEVKIKGAGPVLRAQCLDYFGPTAVQRCEVYPEK